MGSVVFSSTYRTDIRGTQTYNVRVSYSESYDWNTNKSTIEITGVELQLPGNGTNWGQLPFFGTVKANNATLLTMNGGAAVRVPLSGSDYCAVAIPASSSVAISHNPDGTGSFTLELVGGFIYGGVNYFCALYDNTQPFGAAAQSKSVALTSHTRQWTVGYDANGGTGVPAAQTKTYNVDLTLSSTRPTRANASAGSYTVTYDANGGSVSPASAAAARTTAFSFSKWNTKANGSGTDYAPGGTYSANAAATLYAQWSASTTTASVTLPTPTRTGYSFNGWYTAASGGSRVGGGGDSYTPGGNITLYAQWTKLSYTLSISAGTGSSITVKRGNTTLSNGATIYYGDVLTITFSANTGYNLGTHTVNGSSFSSGGSHTVNGAVSVVSTASLKTYTLSISAGTGSTITVKKGTTPLANGATVTHGDVLTITFGALTGYDLGTHTVNGSSFSSGGTHTVAGAVSVVATASLKSYTLSISVGTGSSVSVKRNGTALSNGATVYYGDQLVITFTASSGYAISTHTVNGSTFTSGGTHTVTGAVSVVATATAQASTILSIPSSVETNASLTVQMNRVSTAYYHKATFKLGTTTLSTSAAFGASLTMTVPRTWFSGSPSVTSISVSASIQTYTDSSCNTAVGSPATATITVTADAGMKPTLATGWAVAEPYNTGTAAASIAGYVKGYSKAKVTFDSGKITNASGATIASYSISCQGTVDSSSPYLTPVLTATSVVITCTVTDSRGRSASGTITLSVMDYANPILSNILVFRCNDSGAASDDGDHYSVKASVSISSLNGQNSAALKCAIAESGGSYGAETSLTSGVASVLGTISEDKSYTVRIRATDALGNTATYFSAITTRKWAMKFRASGNGVAFGKSAELENALDLPSTWTTAIDGVATGGVGYCKMPNGTLIQWGSVSGLSFNNQAYLSGEVGFTYPFVTTGMTPKVFVVPGDTAVSDYAFRMGCSASGTGFAWSMFSGSGGAITVSNRIFSWIAIGRWK